MIIKIQSCSNIYTRIMPSPLDQPEQPTPAEVQDEVTGDFTAQVTDDQPPQPLAIDFGEATDVTTDSQTEPLQTLDIGDGDAIKLDSLGPIIVNNDGVCDYPRLTPLIRANGMLDVVQNTELVRIERYRERKNDSTTREEA